MKRILGILSVMIGAALLISACAGGARNEVNFETASFEDLFAEHSLAAIDRDVFSLIGEDFGVLTAGGESDFNSMVIGWGGWGIAFNRPEVFHILRANRYTLEKMREEGRYTLTFFDPAYKGDVMEFGRSSGRDSDKMQKTALHAVTTPSGNIAYKEASIILECTLSEVTTVAQEDFLNPEDRKFIVDAYEDVGEYHKLVFGTVDKVWIGKHE